MRSKKELLEQATLNGEYEQSGGNLAILETLLDIRELLNLIKRHFYG